MGHRMHCECVLGTPHHRYLIRLFTKAFELLTGRWLFHPEDGGEDWSIEEDHLAKMLELTGERFSDAMLQRSHRRDDYFDKAGT